jgi:hypothetical protein
MSGSFKPISPERAEQIRQALQRARASNQGIAIDKQTGQFTGTAPLNQGAQEKVNMIGKFDTHYRG